VYYRSNQSFSYHIYKNVALKVCNF